MCTTERGHIMAETISDTLRKVFLTGIGAAAATAEKSKEVIDRLVEKGELTIDQGKVLNEELRQNLKEHAKNSAFDSVMHNFNELTPQQQEALKARFAQTNETTNATDSEMFEDESPTTDN